MFATEVGNYAFQMSLDDLGVRTDAESGEGLYGLRTLELVETSLRKSEVCVRASPCCGQRRESVPQKLGLPGLDSMRSRQFLGLCIAISAYPLCYSFSIVPGLKGLR